MIFRYNSLATEEMTLRAISKEIGEGVCYHHDHEILQQRGSIAYQSAIEVAPGWRGRHE